MARKSTLTQTEIDDILSNPVDIFPEPSDIAKAKGITKKGPSQWQRPLFMWEYPWINRIIGKGGLHAHGTDEVLAYGGRGGGKTVVNVALNMFFLTTFPGCETICGANVYADIEEIVLPKFRKLLSIKSDWDHPFVKHVPNKQDKWLSLAIPVQNEKGEWIEKTSIAHFTHFSDIDRLPGKEYVYAGFEEISKLKEERILDEVSRSVRSPLAPFRMIFAATNPADSMSHWMYRHWDLSELMSDFEGDKPTPVVCKCQFCQDCLNDLISPTESLYDENGLCTNPECSFLKFCIKNKLPPTRAKQSTYKIDFGHKDSRGKNLCCPGNQSFRRVIHSTALDNPHMPADLVQGFKAGQDEANFAVFTMGDVRALRSNKVFPAFSYAANTYVDEFRYSAKMLADPTKNIVWTHDHNTRPRCSVIVQEYPQDDNDEIYPSVLDEIVMYDTKEDKFNSDGKRVRGVGPEHVAQEFIDRYSEWNEESIRLGEQKSVLIHGDHTALNSKMSPFSRNEFQIMHDMLVEAGFKVLVCVRKIEGKTQITVSDRVALTNWMLRDNKGINRIKINKRCKHLLKALEDLEKKSNDKEETNKACDELARKSTNINITHLISHPADAFGYYLVRTFNPIQEGNLIKFLYIPNGGSLVNIDFANGTLNESPKYSEPEQPRKTQEEMDKEYIDSYLQQIRSYTNQDKADEEAEIFSRFTEYFL